MLNIHNYKKKFIEQAIVWEYIQCSALINLSIFTFKLKVTKGYSWSKIIKLPILKPHSRNDDEDSVKDASGVENSNQRNDKRRFDSIEAFDAFGDLKKRRLDSFDNLNAFADLSKRRLDSIEAFNAFGDLKKKRSNSPHSSDCLKDLADCIAKRRFDSIENLDAFADLSKRRFDSIEDFDTFSDLTKRRFDSIESLNFGDFEKRHARDSDNYPVPLARHSQDEMDEKEDYYSQRQKIKRNYFKRLSNDFTLHIESGINWCLIVFFFTNVIRAADRNFGPLWYVKI